MNQTQKQQQPWMSQEEEQQQQYNNDDDASFESCMESLLGELSSDSDSEIGEEYEPLPLMLW